MTDVDNLDDLANAISSGSPKIKAYAVAQAAATQSQEVDIRETISQLADAITRIEALENPPPDPEPEPPAGIKLTWAPPNTTGFEQITISNAARSHVVTPGTGRKAVFTFAETITAGDVLIQGWDSFVIIGGEILRTGTPGQNIVGMKIYNCGTGSPGIGHIEGLYVHGGNGSLVDCIVLSSGRTAASGAAGLDLRLQMCHLRNDFDNSGLHADNVQLWTTLAGSPATYVGGVGPFKMDRCTGYSLRQGLQMGNTQQALGNLDIRNSNFEHIPGSTLGPIGAHIILKAWRTDFYGRTSTMTFDNVWVHDGFSGYGKQNWVVPDGAGGYDGQFPDPTRANSLLSDAQGQYLDWLHANADVIGIARLGRPPSGDFAPLGPTGPGMNYVSPGYL